MVDDELITHLAKCPMSVGRSVDDAIRIGARFTQRHRRVGAKRKALLLAVDPCVHHEGLPTAVVHPDPEASQVGVPNL